MASQAQQAFAQAVALQRESAAPVVPHVVNGQHRHDGPVQTREDPSNTSTTASMFHDGPESLVLEAIAASRNAQREWRKVPLTERLDRMRPALEFIEKNAEEWAVRVAIEVGKPYEAAIAEAIEVRDILRFQLQYAAAPGAFEDERAEDPAGLANDSVLKPYGVFGVIVPFNYPIVQAAGPIIGALIAGNGVVVKTSSDGPWSGIAAYEMTEVMNLPRGLVNVVHGRTAGQALVASDVDGASFTGSVAVGRSIIDRFTSGAFPRPVIAEMGGKNPVIVTDDADLEAAADGIVFSSMDLGGQKCSALSRVLVSPGATERLIELVEERVRGLKSGDPVRPDVIAGPVVSQDALNRFERLIQDARSAGFRVAQGEVESEGGYFVAPTVISGVPYAHDLATVEHFLPIVTISEVADLEEALSVANSTDMGLTAGIYAGNLDDAREFLDRIEAGCINVNVPGHATTGWWPGPQTFGGWKGSGSTGKQTLGKWYFSQFARQQARKLPANLEHLLGY